MRWRYRLVADGFAVVVPQRRGRELAGVPGVAEVWPNVRLPRARSDGRPEQIGADQLWGPNFATAGNGMKIGIIDDGIDASNPYFDPSGLHVPARVPEGPDAVHDAEGDRAARVPAARRRRTSTRARRSTRPSRSTRRTSRGSPPATTARPRAATRSPASRRTRYLGNYKALTIPTPGFGLDGNSAEIAAAIEAAVADGMNVINLSLGEPEVEPSRDLVVQAIDGAAAAGVVPVIAAGNDFDEFGYGSVASPGNAPDAITVAAVDAHDQIADFSSAGPTPVSLADEAGRDGARRRHPLVAARARRARSGSSAARAWRRRTSSGAAALLKERHPTWTVAQIKSALEQTRRPGATRPSGAEVLATREGGGVVDLAARRRTRCSSQRRRASRSAGSRPVRAATRTVTLADAGGGAGDWTVTTLVQGGSGTLAAADGDRAGHARR